MTHPAPLLSVPPARRRWEEARAREIQDADAALTRSRIHWALLGFLSVGLGYLPMAFAFHTASRSLGDVLFWTAILLTDVGPLVVLWCWAQSETPR